VNKSLYGAVTTTLQRWQWRKDEDKM